MPDEKIEEAKQELRDLLATLIATQQSTEGSGGRVQLGLLVTYKDRSAQLLGRWDAEEFLTDMKTMLGEPGLDAVRLAAAERLLLLFGITEAHAQPETEKERTQRFIDAEDASPGAYITGGKKRDV